MRLYPLKSHRLKTFLSLLFFLFAFSCNKGETYTFNKPPFQTKKTIKDEYLGLFFTDKKIGYFQGTANEIIIEGKEAYFLSGTGVIKLDLGSEKLYTILKEEIILTKSYEPLYFHYSQKIGESSLEIKGIKKDKDIILRTYTAGKFEDEKIAGNILPLSAAGFIVWKEGIKEGKKCNFNVYVEAMQKIETLKVEVGKPFVEKGQNIYPLKQSLGNINITSYVYENGDTYKEESVQGFTLKKMSKEEAVKLEDVTSIYDILAYVAIPVNIEGNVDDIKGIVFELCGIKDIMPKSSDYQIVKKEGDRILIHTSKMPLSKEKISSLEKYLKATSKIQSSEGEIIKTAQMIVGNAKEEEEKVKKVVSWVNKNVKKSLKDRTSALEVLKTMEGECEAHSMLTAALLRSLKIPTKLVGGITYSKENKSFLYHAWNEAYIGGQFVPIDATFGQYPADPTHIKLTEEENTEDITLYLGRVSLKIIEIKR